MAVLMVLAGIVFGFSAVNGTVMATGTSESSGYDPVIYDDSISFSAVLQNDGSVKTGWSKYTHPESFSFYKLVRSQDNSNPVYPDNGYIYYEGNVDVLSYTDDSVPAGTNYYRVCQVASPKRYCSRTVVKVDAAGAEVINNVVSQPEVIPEVVTPDNVEAGEVDDPVEGFEDVARENFAADCLTGLAADQIVVSGEGIHFRPDSSINRAEFLKMVMKTYYPDSSVNDGKYCFADVGGNAWYASFICGAKSGGIVSGYSDNTYRPSRNITRAEGAAILVKALHLPLMAWEGVPFRDVWTDWQKTVVAMAYHKELVNGYSETVFGPNNLLTRAQAAKLICNARDHFTAPLEGEVPQIGTSGNAGTEPVVPADGGLTVDLPEVKGTASRTVPLLVNHATTNLVIVSDDYVNAAKSVFKIAYGHTSHGSQLVTGMEVLEGQEPLYSYSSDGSGGALYLNESFLSGDLGGDWETQTRNLLNNNTNGINMVMWSWCGQLSSMSTAEVNDYLQKMDQLEQDFPKVTFVYMTGHLDGSGEAGQLNQNNQTIRKFASDYNKVLFDFADIESYNPAGSYFLNLNATDNNDYDGGNWAQNWCSTNSGSPLCATNVCAHSQPLNCNLKGRAFWWMMARLAGWNG